MRRWVRYEAPIMGCIDLDETGYTGTVVNVVLGTDPDGRREVLKGLAGDRLVVAASSRHDRHTNDHVPFGRRAHRGSGCPPATPCCTP
jgi:hypothetical protein